MQVPLKFVPISSSHVTEKNATFGCEDGIFGQDGGGERGGDAGTGSPPRQSPLEAVVGDLYTESAGKLYRARSRGCIEAEVCK